MAVTVTNLIQGPADLYHGWFGTAVEPASSAVNATPASSAGWTDAGGTKDGVSLEVAIDWSELEVDQLVDVPGRRMTKRDMQVKTNLVEGTIENIVRTMNGGTSATGTGFKSYEPNMDNSAVDPEYAAIIVNGIADNSRRRQVHARKALQIENMAAAYKKDEQWVLPAAFATHYVSASIPPFKIVDATS